MSLHYRTTRGVSMPKLGNEALKYIEYRGGMATCPAGRHPVNVGAQCTVGPVETPAFIRAAMSMHFDAHHA